MYYQKEKQITKRLYRAATAAEKEIKMKVYNVEDANGFFEVLFRCSGDVEIIAKDGRKIPVKDKEIQKVVRTAYSRATIREMELKFSSTDDSMKVLGFLGSIKSAA